MIADLISSTRLWATVRRHLDDRPPVPV